MPNEQETIKRIKVLINQLNKYRDAYYNNNESLVSNHEYDTLYDELTNLEKTTGFVFSNSPTHTVGYEVKSKLNKVTHSHPMLSLDKTKDVKDIIAMFNKRSGVAMLKMDGLTVSLRYVNGDLVSAETRGNGTVGEDILHNAKTFSNIPLHINSNDEIIIDGEAIITYDSFERINQSLPENNKYRNPRNLASGSVRQLDSKITAQRDIKFIAWKLIDAKNRFKLFDDSLKELNNLGFDVVPFCVFNTSLNIKNCNNIIDGLRIQAQKYSYPIDGIVFGFNDIDYGNSLGATSHHLRSQIAFKFYDEETESILRHIDWTIGKTGVLTPTAVFDPVEIEGTMIERASVHNVSILKELDLCEGDIIEVYKSNQIIPQIKRNVSSKERKKMGQVNSSVHIPKICPICGSKTITEITDSSITLKCSNINCKGKLLGQLLHFVSKNAINIEGLSESTLRKFIDLGFINSYADIYNLYQYYDQLISLDGFGKKSIDNLLEAIEQSKTTTLDRFINALNIPLVGKAASKTIANELYTIKKFLAMSSTKNDIWRFMKDFGWVINKSINDYMEENYPMVKSLSQIFTFEEVKPKNYNANISGKTFVVTGSILMFANRNEMKEKIESLGGKVVGTVSKNTNYLINNNIDSTSNKNKKAKELGVTIITEEQLMQMIN